MQSISSKEKERDAMNKRTLCLVIPTFNEIENIRTLVERVQKIRIDLPFNLIVLVVDDNSPDGTSGAVAQLAAQWDNVKLLRRLKPTGLGSAYIDGFKHGLKEFNADYLGEMDADLQHPPELLVEMCKASAAGNDVVLASRYIAGGGAENWGFGRRLVSKGANVLTKIFLSVPVADATSGYRLMSSRIVKGLLQKNVSSKGYAFQVQSLYVYKKLGSSFAEVPYEFGTRKAGKTKLNWKEIIRFAGSVIRTGILGVGNKQSDAIESYSSNDSLEVLVEKRALGS